jgi:hypothetical protein
MRATIGRLALLWTWLAVGCTGSSPGGGGSDRGAGAESFVAQAPGGGARNVTASGGLGPVQATPQPAADDAAAREVVEGDLYALDGSTLYVLNAYRGLQIVDLADPAQPRLEPNGVRATGTPVDLYVRGGVAYFTVSDSVVWAWAADAGGVAPRGGSQVWAVDVSNPAAPQVLSRLDVEGSAVETRLVGDVLYVFSRRYGWWDYGYGYATLGGVSSGVAVPAGTGVAGVASANPYYLASFDLTHPSAPAPVQVVTFDATGWDAHAHITAERVTFAQSRYEANGPRSQFELFDISDPGGKIVPGATFDAPGQIVDRWAMDFTGGVFRAVLADGWSGGATLRSWTSPSVVSAVPAGALAVGAGEQLTAARFDAARAYLVTARSYDPLFVVDTSDAAHPRLGGEVVMPGQLDFIEPRGTRLVALGHTNESGTWQLAVSVFDVADALHPLRTSVATVGGADWAWIGSSRDDLRKAFQVLDAAGLVLVPFQGWDRESYRWVGGLQLLDLDLAAGTVLARALVQHQGAITRAFPLGSAPGLLCALSDQRLQLVDATDRVHPAELAHLDLARPVIDLAFVNDAAVELAGDWSLGDTALVVTDPLDPDAATPRAELPLASPRAQLFTVGASAWLLAQDFGVDGGRAWLQGVDLSDPASPRLGGRLDVTPGAAGSASWLVPWGHGDEATIAGSLLAVHRAFWRGPMAVAAQAGAPAGPEDEVLLYDLSDVDAPRLAGRVALEGSDWAWGLTASSGSLWLTDFTWSEGSADDGRYHLVRIDVSQLDAPRVAARVNVPGVFLGADAGATRVYVLETVWPDGAASASPRSFVRALDLTPRGTARLAASVELAGSPSGALVDGARAYVATSLWSATETATSLAAVDLSAMRVASTQQITSQGFASPLRAEGGKLFLTGWARGNVFLVYDLADPSRPAFEQSVPTLGWVRSVAVRGEYAYLPSGPYGVPMVKLAR